MVKLRFVSNGTVKIPEFIISIAPAEPLIPVWAICNNPYVSLDKGFWPEIIIKSPLWYPVPYDVISTLEMEYRLEEPLLVEDNTRFIQLPIKYQKLQDAYDTHESMFWSAKEIDYSADLPDWYSLSNDERYFIEHILAFFAGSDGIVLENLIKNFCVEVKATEARNFYAFQGMMGNISGEISSSAQGSNLINNMMSNMMGMMGGVSVEDELKKIEEAKDEEN